jgi:AcrR family transcriptional regulator
VPAADDGAVAIDGRPLGRRAQLTRQRLLDATRELLAENGIRDLRVVDIARHVGTSPATFYQYFRDVEEAVLTLSEGLGDGLSPMIDLLGEPLRGKAGLDTTCKLMDGFISYWDEHRAVLRVRNLAAEEGDQRFRDVRNRTLGALTEAIRKQIAEQQSAGKVDAEVSPYTAAAGLVAMMERMAAHHLDLEPRGTTRRDIVETVGRIIHQTVTGRRG